MAFIFKTNISAPLVLGSIEKPTLTDTLIPGVAVRPKIQLTETNYNVNYIRELERPLRAKPVAPFEESQYTGSLKYKVKISSLRVSTDTTDTSVLEFNDTGITLGSLGEGPVILDLKQDYYLKTDDTCINTILINNLLRSSGTNSSWYVPACTWEVKDSPNCSLPNSLYVYNVYIPDDINKSATNKVLTTTKDISTTDTQDIALQLVIEVKTNVVITKASIISDEQ